jgi:rare lipoprotein A (peptidoglycan hydrolase)
VDDAEALRAAARAIQNGKNQDHATAASTLFGEAIRKIGVDRMDGVLIAAEKAGSADIGADHLPPSGTQPSTTVAQSEQTGAPSTALVAKPRSLSGYATFYNLRGKIMASGKPFDPTSMSAAMTSDRAPIGSTVTVELKGVPNSAITVTITDTGPFERDANGKTIKSAPT